MIWIKLSQGLAWRKVVHQWCGFRGGHSGNKPADTVVPMVSYGIYIYDYIQDTKANQEQI